MCTNVNPQNACEIVLRVFFVNNVFHAVRINNYTVCYDDVSNVNILRHFRQLIRFFRAPDGCLLPEQTGRLIVGRNIRLKSHTQTHKTVVERVRE
jgi:hypothetical protein